MQGRSPRVPSIVHTRVLLQRFIDAYNGHDVHRALSTMTGSVAYRDRGYIAGRWLDGKTAVGTWLNLAEALQRIIVRRALSGQHPQTTEEIITWLDDTVAAWNEDPTPFTWGGKRKERRDRARQRRLGGSPALLADHHSNAA